MRPKWLLFIALLLMYGCSGEEDIINPDTSEICTVGFTSANVDAVLTRGSTYIPKNTQVGISAYLVSSDVEATDYFQSRLFTVTDAIGTLTPQNGNISLFKNTKYNFYAYSPALAFKTGSKKTMEISNGTDFLLASVAQTINDGSTIVTLPALSHKCSLVQFYVKRLTSNVLVRNVTIGSAGLTYSNITHSPVSYTLGVGDGNIKLDGVPQDGSLNVPGASFTTEIAGSDYIGSSVLLPKTNAAFQLNLNLIFNNSPVSLVATIPAIAFAQGSKYLYTVEISDDIVKVCLVLDWNKSASGSNLGAPNAKIEVGSWNLIKEQGTTVGGSNTTVSVSNWVVNPSWAATLGASNSNGSVTGWNPDIVGSNTAGGSNTSGNVSGWGTSGSSATGGTNNSGGSVNGWGSDVTGNTTAGGSNTNSNVSGWGTSGSSATGGGNNSAGSVKDWGSDVTGNITAGGSNTTGIVSGWGTSGSSATGGTNNSGGSVKDWGSTVTTSTNFGL
jgi:hypothetical protein